jgi:acyl-CoA reductase-like NAD-dependent aldehyde dehydrogenase
MSEDQSDETSDNDTKSGPTDPVLLLKVRARHAIRCWDELTATTRARAFEKTKRAMEQLESACEDVETAEIQNAVDAMTPEQVLAFIEMMGVNVDELSFRASALREKLEKEWGADAIMRQHLNEGGTPT